MHTATLYHTGRDVLLDYDTDDYDSDAEHDITHVRTAIARFNDNMLWHTQDTRRRIRLQDEHWQWHQEGDRRVLKLEGPRGDRPQNEHELKLSYSNLKIGGLTNHCCSTTEEKA